MTLMLNHCSNPECHDRYTPGSYQEAVALLLLGDGTAEYRTFSLCVLCKAKLDETMVVNVLKDVIEYETKEKHELVSISRAELTLWHSRYDKWTLTGWGKSRIELDDKLKIV